MIKPSQRIMVTGKKKGFSLIEVLMTLAISIFILLGTAEALLHCLSVKRRVEIREKVRQLISTEIETLRSYDFTSSNLKEGTSIFSVQDKISSREYRLIKTIQDKAPGLKSIKITAFPHDRPTLRTEVIFYISQDLGFQP
ncbi:prepilin-type N-terminal cleavage/methylation domain-containing protein [Candidatus Aminicenantes bacterium AC-334-K16]|jgi:prepilin-type N-terminal cleavage/methylation domain-containing protein|nr:prepilin-type N-terminal cleavage/methylation domain-containing protein [Candidatus Aminicenantes bacterium AC-334-K16]